MNALWSNNTKTYLLVASALIGAGVPLWKGDLSLRKRDTRISAAIGAAGLAAALFLPTTEEQAAAKNTIPVLNMSPAQRAALLAAHTKSTGTGNPG